MYNVLIDNYHYNYSWISSYLYKLIIESCFTNARNTIVEFLSCKNNMWLNWLCIIYFWINNHSMLILYIFFKLLLSPPPTDQSHKHLNGQRDVLLLFLFVCLFFVFLPFLGLLPQHMEAPRLEVKSEL